MAALGACAGSKAPPPSTDIDETVYREHLRVLSADDFEGRRPASKGEEKTLSYLTEQFRKLGLKPLSEKSYVQPVPLTELTPGEAHVTLQGAQGPRRLEIGKDVLLVGGRAEPTVELAGSELVFVGFGIVAPEFTWNDYAGLDVRGKTVLVLAGDPGPGGRESTLFRGSALSAYGRPEYKVEEAARQGAAAVLLVHDPAVLGHGWEALRNLSRAPQLRLANAPATAPGLQGWVSLEAARRLFAEAGADFAAASAAAARPGSKPVLLHVRVDATLSQAVRTVTSSNIGAILPGGKKDEYIVFVAHWDSLGRDPALAGHDTFNGAIDNASGVAGLLTLAQSFARTKPEAERSMVFLATTAGLSGYLGATYYLKNPVLPLRQTAAVVDVENLLPGGHSRDVSIFGMGSSELDESARGAALLQGREVRADPFPGLGLYYRSEAFVFARNGIPALYAVSGVDNAARGPAYGTAQRQQFMAHVDLQLADQYSPDADVRGALDDLAMYYEVGLRVARNHRFPRWRPDSEFRTRTDAPAN